MRAPSAVRCWPFEGRKPLVGSAGFAVSILELMFAAWDEVEVVSGAEEEGAVMLLVEDSLNATSNIHRKREREREREIDLWDKKGR